MSQPDESRIGPVARQLNEELGRAAPERVGARVALAQPRPGHEVGGRLLVGLEVAVEGEEDEDVLLGVRPAAGLAVGEKALHELGDEVASRLVGDESLEQVARLREAGVRLRALTNSLASNDLVTNHSGYARRRPAMPAPCRRAH